MRNEKTGAKKEIEEIKKPAPEKGMRKILLFILIVAVVGLMLYLLWKNPRWIKLGK